MCLATVVRLSFSCLPLESEMGTTPSKAPKSSTGPKLLNLGVQTPPLTSLEHLEAEYAHYLTPSLISLNVSHNSLTSIPSSLFGLIPSLELLDLSGNALADTLPVTLPSLKHLRELYLGMNRFSIIPDPVFYLSTSLTALELPSNELEEIPERISVLVNLTRLDICSNHITSIPDEVGKLTNLIYLRGRANLIEHVTPLIGQLHSLSTLDLRQNELESLPNDCLPTSGALEKLLLSDNLLRSVPELLSECVGLTELDLAGNKISSLPHLGNLSALKRLLLQENRLANIPVLDDMQMLRELDLRHNHLTSVDNLLSCPSLQLLSIRENRLTSLPKTMNGWRNLEEFDASENMIEAIPDEIGDITTLTRVYLSNNAIGQIPSSLSKLTRLRLLGLAYNELDDSSFPPSLWNSFSVLVELRLLGNFFTALPRGFDNLKRLDRLFMGYNEFVPHGEEKEEPCYDNLNLSQLSLSGNSVMAKIPDAILHTTTLRKLWLGDCGIKFLPPAISNLQVLEVLDLSHNKLMKLPKQICAIPTLIELLVPHNDLSKLPVAMDQLVSLQLFDVSYNPKLSKLPLGLARIDGLLQVKAVHCAIDELPEPWMNFTGYPPAPPPLAGLLLANERPPPPVGLQLKWVALEGNPLDGYTLPNYVKFRVDQELRAVVPKSRPRLGEPNRPGSSRAKSFDEPKNPALTPVVSTTARVSPIPPQAKCLFEVNLSEMQGIRPTMEDAFLIQEHRGLIVGPHTFQLLAIFDGHADAACAEFCATHMHDILQSELSYALQPKDVSTSKVALLYKSDSVSAIKKNNDSMDNVRPHEHAKSAAIPTVSGGGSVRSRPSKRGVSGDADHDYFISCVKHGLRNTFKRMNDCIDEYDIQSGCTVALALFCGNDAWLVSCGDARVTVAVGNRAIRATVDHKATDREERHRIQDLGGYITDAGRIMGMIAVARSLGDRAFRPYVAYTPAVKWMKITEETKFAIIACDGLWDVVSDDFAVQLVEEYHKKHGTYVGAALMLRESAYALGSGDNISTMVFGLKPIDRSFLTAPGASFSSLPGSPADISKASTAPLDQLLLSMSVTDTSSSTQINSSSTQINSSTEASSSNVAASSSSKPIPSPRSSFEDDGVTKKPKPKKKKADEPSTTPES